MPVASKTSSARKMRCGSVWRKSRGGFRIARRKFGVQRLRALALRARAHRLAHLGRNGGNVGEAIERRLEIHPRAADDDRGRALRFEVAQRRARSSSQRPTE